MVVTKQVKKFEEEPKKVNCPFDKGDCRYCTVQFCGAREENQIETRSTAEPVENPKKGCPTYPLSVVGDLLAKTPPAPIRFEQEQPEEICSKCVYHKKDDGYCYNPHGGMKRRINENGVYECTAFWEREQKEQKPVEWSEEDENNIGKLHRLLVICQSEKKFIPTSEYEKLDKWLKSLRPQPKRKQSPALKKIIDNLTEEKLAKTRAEMKPVEEEPVDLEKEIKNKRRTMLLDVLGLMNGVQCLAIEKFARYFYELGLKRKEE